MDKTTHEDAVIRRGQTVLELSNIVSDRLLGRLAEVMNHPRRCCQHPACGPGMRIY